MPSWRLLLRERWVEVLAIAILAALLVDVNLY
jgi:hypothetical protein